MKLNFENAKVIIQPRKGGLEPAIFITEGDKIYMVTIGPDGNFCISNEGNVGERYDNNGNYCEGSKQNGYVDFVNEDRYDEMEELSRSLFGENWGKDWKEDGICLINNHFCSYCGSCNTCPVNINSKTEP